MNGREEIARILATVRPCCGIAIGDRIGQDDPRWVKYKNCPCLIEWEYEEEINENGERSHVMIAVKYSGKIPF